jgi:hypothetical protein
MFLHPGSGCHHTQIIGANTSLQADDELADPYLAGFEWDKEESWTRLVVHLQKQPSTGGPVGGASKKKKKNKEEE